MSSSRPPRQLRHEPWHVGAITGGGYAARWAPVEALYRALHVDPQFTPGERGVRTPEGDVRELSEFRGTP